MSGPLQLVLVAAVGTALLIGVLFALRLSRTRALDDPDAVLALIRRWNPDVAPGPVLIAQDRRMAVMALPGGRLCAALVMGDDVAVRAVAADAWQVEGDGSLRIDPRDAGFPPQVLRAGSEAVADWNAQRSGQ